MSYFSFKKTEIFQLLNHRPVSAVEIQLLIDNSEERLSEDQVSKFHCLNEMKQSTKWITRQVELLLQLVSETLPSHLSEEAEEEEQEGEEGDGDQEQDCGEEEAAAPDTGGQDNWHSVTFIQSTELLNMWSIYKYVDLFVFFTRVELCCFVSASGHFSARSTELRIP